MKEFLFFQLHLQKSSLMAGASFLLYFETISVQHIIDMLFFSSLPTTYRINLFMFFSFKAWVLFIVTWGTSFATTHNPLVQFCAYMDFCYYFHYNILLFLLVQKFLAALYSPYSLQLFVGISIILCFVRFQVYFSSLFYLHLHSTAENPCHTHYFTQSFSSYWYSY